MSSDPSDVGTETERLRFCTVHEKPCEKCSACDTYSYCPECDKCYEPDCAKGWAVQSPSGLDAAHRVKLGFIELGDTFFASLGAQPGLLPAPKWRDLC